MTRKTLLLLCSLSLFSYQSFASKKADSLHAIAVAHFNQGDYDLMLQYTLAALKICEENGTPLEKATAMMNVGRAYYHLQQKQTSLKYMLAARKIARSSNVDSIMYKSARQAGAIYLETGKTDSAIILLNEADTLLRKATDYGEHSSVFSILGDLYYYNKKNKERGWIYYNLAKSFALKSDNKNSLAYAYMKMGIANMNENKCEVAEDYYRKAWALYKEMKVIEGEMYAMSTLGKALSDCGKTVESYTIMRQLMSIKDSIFKNETAKKTALFRTLYETEKKEKENLALSKENALKKLEVANEIKSKRLLAIIFILLASALVITFMYIYNRYRIKKKAELNMELARQEKIRFKAVIEAEENERKRIAADLHDGVGQLMSAAKINLVVMQDELPFENEDQKLAYSKAIALVDESCNEVRTVSHNMMPNVLLKSGLVNAIRAFVGQINEKILKINLYTDGLNEGIESNTETVLYRVVQECVNNVIKHSGANRLDISIIKDVEGISATIEDNGKGFDTSIRTDFEGIGLKNIRSRISYLKGTVEWDSAPGKGTVVTIFVPATS